MIRNGNVGRFLGYFSGDGYWVCAWNAVVLATEDVNIGCQMYIFFIFWVSNELFDSKLFLRIVLDRQQ